MVMIDKIWTQPDCNKIKLQRKYDMVIFNK